MYHFQGVRQINYIVSAYSMFLGELKSLRADNGLDHEVLNSWKYLAGDKSSRAVHLIKYPKVRLE